MTTSNPIFLMSEMKMVARKESAKMKREDMCHFLKSSIWVFQIMCILQVGPMSML